MCLASSLLPHLLLLSVPTPVLLTRCRLFTGSEEVEGERTQCKATWQEFRVTFFFMAHGSDLFRDLVSLNQESCSRYLAHGPRAYRCASLAVFGAPVVHIPVENAWHLPAAFSKSTITLSFLPLLSKPRGF